MAEFDVHRLPGPFGVEIDRFDVGLHVDQHAQRELRSLFDRHGLLIFRDVDLDFQSQQSLVEALVGAPPSLVDGRTPDGDVVEEFHVTNEVDGAYVGTGKLLFHTDAMWSDDPFELISLYGVRVDPTATPTVFASTALAWQTLPSDLRTRAEGLHAVHGEGQHSYEGDEYASHPAERDRTRTTSVGLPHPRTGQTLLYVSEQQTRQIVELDRSQSDELMYRLRAHLYAPEHTFVHRWREGDLVVWDNLSIQHARADVRRDGPRRTLRKAVVPPPWLWSVQYA
jgi:alpha-ketoglutarate-dependent taurine dioxygenase